MSGFDIDAIIASAKNRAKRLSVFGDRDRHLTRTKQRSHKKRHGENKEKSFFDRSKHKKSQHTIKENNKKYRDFKNRVRDYWTGKIDEYPEQ